MIKWIRLHWIKVKGQVEQSPLQSYKIDKILREKRVKYSERLDEKYSVCDLQTLRSVVAQMPIHKQQFTKELHDCDNFAYEFFALTKRLFPTLAVGICHVEAPFGRHAMNWAIYRRSNRSYGTVYIEPQTGEVKFFRNYNPYLMVI